jgi:hypothetical protein
MKTILILLMVILTGPAWGQSSPPTKIYKWNHPWFKKEITSPTPPTWEYRVIEEKNGVVFVEVTPPGTPSPKVVEATPKPTYSPAPTSRPLYIPQEDTADSCKKLGPFARTIAEMRQNGVPLRNAEAGIIILLGNKTTPDGLKFAREIAKSVYANKLTTENAEEITVATCQVLVLLGESKQNRK